MTNGADAPDDVTDRAVAQWRAQRPDLDFSAMGPLARLARLAIFGGRLVDRVFETEGLDRGDFNVLAGLRRSGPPYRLTPSELADALLTTRGAMTKRVDRLEALGLVKRTANGADRRSLHVGLTDEGLRRIDALIVHHVENESRLLAVLAPREVAALDYALRKLLHSIGDGA
ncbi:MarR family winged helix-turn-helix transcriptional regulator [Microbacterium sp.]|uniref:MarR family winged helix-turn-helix transcriptional regulator n=1 Tax=Microbacterium sp. TaxID=51671 RepID=UPI003C78B7DB